jgi:hypothetical protein
MVRWMMVGFLALLFGRVAAAADVSIVDLSGAANASFEVDSSGNGGWLGEGVNDMGIYPPIAVGETVRNGYHFSILDPRANHGKSVLLLRGKTRQLDKPAEVTVKVAGAHAKFLYVLQNCDHDLDGAQAHAKVAEYTVLYADGTDASIDIHDQVEMHAWWTGSWFTNSGSKAWPIFMGKNSVSMKYNQFIGVWAMQWANPHPEKAIVGLTFKSEQLVVPAIFAATLADEDYFNSPHAKDDFKRPAEAPAGFFDEKLQFQQRQLLQEMVASKIAQGVRKVEAIRPNLLAVTVDSLLSGGEGPGEKAAAALQSPEHFSVGSDQDAAFQKGVHPAQVGRQTDPYDNVDIGKFDSTKLYWHTFYLALPVPLHDGDHYRVTVAGLPAGAKHSVDFDYSNRGTISEAIKVNQVVYAIRSQRRYAYLGWWAGDLGKVDFSDCKQFSVVDEATGKVALSGPIVLRKASDDISGEDVYEMDLAGLTRAGRYHLVAPGVGRSYPFSLGGDEAKLAYITAMRGFLYQRCGCELSADVTDGYPRHTD